MTKQELEQAVKEGANLEGADLRGANLEGAYLWGAYLEDADLEDADLRDADLRGANLVGANLRGANLRGADLRGAYLSDTSIYTFQLGKHFGFYHQGNVQIGCEYHSLEYWIEHCRDIGIKHNYSNTEIKIYEIILKGLCEYLYGEVPNELPN